MITTYLPWIIIIIAVIMFFKKTDKVNRMIVIGVSIITLIFTSMFAPWIGRTFNKLPLLDTYKSDGSSQFAYCIDPDGKVTKNQAGTTINHDGMPCLDYASQEEFLNEAGRILATLEKQGEVKLWKKVEIKSKRMFASPPGCIMVFTGEDSYKDTDTIRVKYQTLGFASDGGDWDEEKFSLDQSRRIQNFAPVAIVTNESNKILKVRCIYSLGEGRKLRAEEKAWKKRNKKKGSSGNWFYDCVTN